MPTPGWINSTRRATLPRNWAHIRKATAQRAGGRCEWPGWNVGRTTRRPGDVPAPHPGNECDHIGDRTVHELWNTQWLCATHHQLKTIEDRRTRSRTDRRPRERHPGLRG